MCVCKFSDHVFEYIAIVAVWLHALFLKLPLWQSMVPVHLVVSMSQLSSWTVFLGRSCDAIARLHSKWRMCHWKIPFEKSHFATAPCPVSRPHLFPGCGSCAWTSFDCSEMHSFCVPLLRCEVSTSPVWDVPLLQRTLCGIRSQPNFCSASTRPTGSASPPLLCGSGQRPWRTAGTPWW